jgi:hypothetical protein
MEPRHLSISGLTDRRICSSFTTAAAGDFAGHKRHWEQYGPVALHFDPAFLRNEPRKLAVYSVKVTYDQDSVGNGLNSLLTILRLSRDFLAQVPQDTLVSHLRHRQFFVSVGSKKSGFRWDEWRLVHTPYLFSSAVNLRRGPSGWFGV